MVEFIIKSLVFILLSILIFLFCPILPGVVVIILAVILLLTSLPKKDKKD